MKGNLPGAQILLSPLESWNPGSVRVQEPGFLPQCTAYLCPVGPKCRESPNVGAPVPEPLPHAGPCLEHPSWFLPLVLGQPLVRTQSFCSFSPKCEVFSNPPIRQDLRSKLNTTPAEILAQFFSPSNATFCLVS